MSETILITGGSGFVGQNIIHILRKQKPTAKIYNLSRKPLQIEGVYHIPCEDAATFDFSSLNQEFDCIIHTLALSNEAYCKDLSYAEKVNIDFTKKLLAFAVHQRGLKKFIHISSTFLYANDNPSPIVEDSKLYLHYSNYGFTKGVAEYYVNHFREKFGLPATIFRLSNIYGPYQSFIDSPFLVPSKIMQAIAEKKIEVFNLTPRRDWIYSEDAAGAIVRALDVSCEGVYNLASGKAISVEDIIKEIAGELGASYTSLNKPTSGPQDMYCDISRITEVLSWNPTTELKDGIAKTIAYIKENLPKQ